MTVGELKKLLEDKPDDIPLGLSVYNHSWYSNCQTLTHGPMYVGMGEFRSGEKILMLYVSGWPKCGYMLRKVGVDG